MAFSRRWLTETEEVQLAAAFTEPPASEIVCEPGLAVMTPADPHVPFSPLGLSMVSAAGASTAKPAVTPSDGLAAAPPHRGALSG